MKNENEINNQAKNDIKELLEEYIVFPIENKVKENEEKVTYKISEIDQPLGVIRSRFDTLEKNVEDLLNNMSEDISENIKKDIRDSNNRICDINNYINENKEKYESAYNIILEHEQLIGEINGDLQENKELIDNYKKEQLEALSIVEDKLEIKKNKNNKMIIYLFILNALGLIALLTTMIIVLLKI